MSLFFERIRSPNDLIVKDASLGLKIQIFESDSLDLSLNLNFELELDIYRVS